MCHPDLTGKTAVNKTVHRSTANLQASDCLEEGSVGRGLPGNYKEKCLLRGCKLKLSKVLS